MKLRNMLCRLWQDDSGQDLTEYALLLVLVALGAVASIGQFANALVSAFSNTASTITNATS